MKISLPPMWLRITKKNVCDECKQTPIGPLKLRGEKEYALFYVFNIDFLAAFLCVLLFEVIEDI